MSFFFDLGCRPLRVLPADRVVTLYVIVRIIGVVPAGFEAIEPAEAEPVDVTTLIINFFTKPDFTELFSRRAF